MKTRCIVIEDEPLAMERLEQYIQKIPSFELAASFDNAMDAFVYLKSATVDVIFLDINLGELSGIQLLESVQISSQVIITTAYPEYALKGYELNVTDYLLKPFTFERFLQAVAKVEHTAAGKASPTNNFFFVKTESRLQKIFFDDVLYIEGMRDYRKIHTSGKPVMTLQTFTEFEQELPPHLVCRVHKSYMVAVSKIDAVEKDRLYIKDIMIPVSETYRQHLLKVIGR